MPTKTLNTLIKLHKQQVDVLRREMVVLEDERQQLQDFTAKLKNEHENEMQLMAQDAQMANFFASYSAGIKKKLQKIAEEISRINNEIAAKLELISEEFANQKRYEIARDNLKERIKQEEKHHLQQRFDEVAVQQFLKKE